MKEANVHDEVGMGGAAHPAPTLSPPGSPLPPVAGQLVRYEAARRALADARSIDDVKQIQDKAVAVEAYAKQAKDGELIGLATEIRKRAERRLGELMAELSANGLMAKGACKKGTDRGSTRVVGGPASLSSHGIDKHLADRARKAAAMPEARFEAEVAKAQQIAVASVAGAREVIAAARAEHHKAKQEKRAKREQQWAGKILAFPTKKYGVILADPEWRFEFYSERGKTNSSADNHYQTSSLDEIKKRDVASISAPDCVLFLWATVPMLPQALEVLAAWGFTYKSHCIWRKNKAGTGYWFRNAHEVLLVGTRGKVVAPGEGSQFPSVIDAPVGEHSAKPAKFYEIIERHFTNVPKIELNARAGRDGWDSWGHEASNEVAEPQRGRVNEVSLLGKLPRAW
jgi:N6-adenosine-specific RNA methylase IME4